MKTLPSIQTAIVARSDGILALSHDVPVPDLEDDMIIVRNVATALNPVDSKLVGNLATPGAVAGMDFAGYVVAIGAKVETAKSIKIGDRVCGTIPGMHKLTPNVGAFSQYVGACDLVMIKLPDSMSFEEAASFGVGISTVKLALFRSLQIPGTPENPTEKPIKVLVYGGSTATGTLAIQILRLSGFIPIATCSPHNFELVKGYGAEEVFDYNDETAIHGIKRYTRHSLKYVLDCISEAETMKFCYQCIGRAGGKYTALEPYPLSLCTRPTVKHDWVLGPMVLGKLCLWPSPLEIPENPEIRQWTRDWFRTIQRLVDEGLLRPHPLKIMAGKYESILHGLDMLVKKQISGEKLICRIPQD